MRRSRAAAMGTRRETSSSSMTSRYAGREKMEAKAACVRAVMLPK
jgi:hypothetical protein